MCWSPSKRGEGRKHSINGQDLYLGQGAFILRKSLHVWPSQLHKQLGEAYERALFGQA